MRGWKQGDAFWQGKKVEIVLILFLLFLALGTAKLKELD